MKNFFEKKSGGSRKGAGRKPLPEDEKKETLRFFVQKKYADEFREQAEKLLEKITKGER